MIDDQERNEVLPHFAGDGAKNCLACRDGIEKLVGFFNRDDQLLGLVLWTARGEILFSFLHIEIMQTARQDVGHQHITEKTALLSEFQHDVDAFFDELHDFEDGIFRDPLLEKIELLQPFQLTMQRRDRFRVCPHFIGEVFETLWFLP